MLPLSFPKKLSTLRFSSALGVISSFLVMFVIVLEFLIDKNVVPDPIENFRNAELFIFSSNGLIETIPFIIFLYMF